MDRHTGVSRGVARVAATAADAPRLPEALADFHADHPGIQIALRQGSAAEVVALVQRGAVDVAVLALRRRAGRASSRRRSPTSRCGWRCRVDDELAGDHRSRWTRCAAARSSSPSRAPRCARLSSRPRRRRGSARCRCSRSATRRRCASSCAPGSGSRSSRRRGSSGPGRWSARRISRSAAPPAVAAHARGGRLTGRPAAARAPARALSSSRLRGRAPTSVWTGAPSRKSMKVGIERTP